MKILKKTKEDFINIANEKHNYKYDYNLVEYVNTQIKVQIICKIHGVFLQSPTNHMKGQGCPICGQISRKQSQSYSKEEFIQTVVKKHHYKYDYSNVNYVNSQTKVSIICPKHGSFLMKPNCHFNGQGCPKCGRINANENIKKDYNTFLERANKIHNGKYEYSEVNYHGITKKMKMYCSFHGFFSQTPHSHISMKTGCPKCGALKASISNQKGWDLVYELFRTVHGDYYEYDIASFKDTTHKMRIKCKKHGFFSQKPNLHYSGSGCRLCKNEENGIKLRVKFEDFILRAKEVHCNKYKYEKGSYKDIVTPMIINCLKHGDFFQSPRHHYRGSGCPKCTSSKGEQIIRQILKNKNLNFIEQKTFDGLIYEKKLKCDFYLPEHNLVIEYNGIQHYESISVFGGIEGLKITQSRDLVKYQFLEKNNIKLLIIKYDNPSIEEYLIDRLKELGA